jgi:hypothetical protein
MVLAFIAILGLSVGLIFPKIRMIFGKTNICRQIIILIVYLFLVTYVWMVLISVTNDESSSGLGFGFLLIGESLICFLMVIYVQIRGTNTSMETLCIFSFISCAIYGVLVIIVAAVLLSVQGIIITVVSVIILAFTLVLMTITLN